MCSHIGADVHGKDCKSKRLLPMKARDLTDWQFAMCGRRDALTNFSVDPMASWLLLLLPKAYTSHVSDTNGFSPGSAPMSSLRHLVQSAEMRESYM